MLKDPEIRYPSYIAKLGPWPLNFGLFFLYNTIVNIVLSFIAAILFLSRGVTDQTVVVEKTQGLAVIGILLTLGITLVFQKTFYVHRVRDTHKDDEGVVEEKDTDNTDDTDNTSGDASPEVELE